MSGRSLARRPSRLAQRGRAASRRLQIAHSKIGGSRRAALPLARGGRSQLNA
jgi:hypothetical protein